MINDEIKQRVEEIGDSALEFNAGIERDSYIEEACGRDEMLKTLVSEYISGGEAMILEPVIRDPRPVSFENRQIGRWKLLHCLGEGGFGIVYLAERNDGQVRQLGAMKFLKGTVRDLDLELRFLDERQILANLNHPWIVRLIDVGLSDEAQAYLVMDFVEDALPIDVYSRVKQLSIRDRLALFRKVCEAVAYAHRKLVVHRDLKPSNILVTRDGTPRLLDFGVAKILDPAHRGSAHTASSTYVLAGTARYFSPEQARREAVDTATDIYSLGVILYELLVGTDPYGFERHPNESPEQVICNVEPELPSKASKRVSGKLEISAASPAASLSPQRIARQLRGDLDNIILTALRKEPHRRYPSVDHFSEDIRRYLEGLPVTARPDTYAYRASKFVQRHKLGVAAAALIFLSVIAGLTATIWQARRAQAAQARAERRFNDLRALASSYLFEFHDAIANVPGTTAARALVVHRALEYLGSLANEASGDQPLQLELATAYQKVGDAQGRPGFANIGDHRGAIESYRRALDIRKALLAAGSTGIRLRLDLATTYDRTGDVLLVTGKSAEALANYRQAYSVRQGLLSESPDNREVRRDFAASCQRIAQALLQTHQMPEAEEKQHRALAMIQDLAANRPRDAVAQRDLFIAYVKQGDLLRATGDKAGALRYYQQALPIARAVESVAEDTTKAGRETASVQDKIGNLLLANKDLAGAMENYRAALRVRESLAVADPNNAEIQRDLSLSHEKIAGTLAHSEKEAALAELRQSLTIDRKLLSRDPDNAQARLDCADDHEKIADLLIKTGDIAAALVHGQEARELREWVALKDEKNVDVRGDLALNYKQLGDANALLAKRSGDVEYLRAARDWYQRAIQVLRDLQLRGALDPDGLSEMTSLATEISKCDIALQPAESTLRRTDSAARAQER
jgi:eukaryotic-like serine/threonine-protein kinase